MMVGEGWSDRSNSRCLCWRCGCGCAASQVLNETSRLSYLRGRQIPYSDISWLKLALPRLPVFLG